MKILENLLRIISMSKLGKIISLANSAKPEKYRILTFPTHERYETQLCKTGHEFYSFHLKGSKKWNKEQVDVPANYHILPENEVSSYLDFDFILVQSKFWQYQVAQQINERLQLPIIVLEHTVPTPQTISKEQFDQMRQMIGNKNVFISEYSKNAWGITYNTKIIHHGLDTETFKDNNSVKQDHILTVANDFIKRDYCLNYSGWERITNGLSTKLIGDTKGLSQPAKDTEELVKAYNECGVYLNTSTLSPIPMSLLEAMSCGCAVVSTATCMIPEIIDNGVNGFISNDESELRSYIVKLLEDKELRNTIGNNARQTIENRFSLSAFISSWNNVFDETYEEQT